MMQLGPALSYGALLVAYSIYIFINIRPKKMEDYDINDKIILGAVTSFAAAYEYIMVIPTQYLLFLIAVYFIVVNVG
jgi:hypothetical protein